ncbi:hypothetical protein [Aliamphritea spongicola]|nr:hypothetical protein [Aliamphritea spongicola]
MPTQEEAQKLTAKQAKEEFWRQTAVWKQSTGKSAKSNSWIALIKVMSV